MKNFSIAYILIPIGMAVFAYLASNNFVVAGIVLLISILYFILFFMREFNEYRLSLKRFKLCYQFINSFIITLSIKQTLPATLESTASSMDDGFKEEYTAIKHLTNDEKLQYLRKYFHFHVYELFLNIVTLYEERGGNVLDMSSHLLEELRNQNEYIIKCESMATKKWVEFAILWFLSLAILVLMRFALSELFGSISRQIIYLGTIVGIFVFALLSMEILARRSFKLDLKGWEKIDE